MEPDDLLCSRNARSRTPLVGRAQWKINQESIYSALPYLFKASLVDPRLRVSNGAFL